MTDTEPRFPPGENNPGPDRENPVLTEEFRLADIPVLDKQVVVAVLEDTIPAPGRE